jgi:hypothetical protein
MVGWARIMEADPGAVSFTNENLTTLLHLAVGENDQDMADLLPANRAEVEVRAVCRVGRRPWGRDSFQAPGR